MHTVFWSVNIKGQDHLEDSCRLVDHISTDFRETGWESVDWVHVAP
jgi:hypothetical protein